MVSSSYGVRFASLFSLTNSPNILSLPWAKALNQKILLHTFCTLPALLKSVITLIFIVGDSTLTNTDITNPVSSLLTNFS